jgi:two-component system sensor kinase FixL
LTAIKRFVLESAPDVPIGEGVARKKGTLGDRPRRTRDRAADAVGDALERYRGILDTAVDGIITIDERGIVESFNRAAERIFGYQAKDVIGRNVRMLMPEPYRAEHDGYIANYVHTGEARIIGIGREVQGRRKDGQVFPMELAVGAVRLSGGRVFTGIVRDITDRKHAEGEAQRRLTELAHMARLVSMGDLATGLAHEVNQPLTAIVSHAQGCLRLLGSDRADLDTLSESLQQIAHQGQRAAEVIRRMREFLRKGESEMRPSLLNATVGEVLWLLKGEIDLRSIRVVSELQPKLPPVAMDPVQIEQVVLNLIRNALDAMEKTPASERTLTVRTQVTPDRLNAEFSVTDTGIGLSPDVAAQLFKPFFSTKAAGLGQGLSICRSIVEAHRGQIWAEPNKEGGATFRFHLPLDRSGRR